MSPGAGDGTKVVRERLPGLPAASFVAAGLGFRPRCAIVLRIASDAALLSGLRKPAAARFQDRHLAGERFPSADRHIEIDGIQLDGWQARPHICAAMIAVPDPQNGS
jgi:hypothetical protein